jgi:hypothetical protein
LTPAAITASAGSIVTSRRTNTGIRTPMKPDITTCPAKVPTLEDEAPEASSATAKASAAAPPTRWPSCACAPAIDSSPDRPGVWKSFAATASIAMLTRPAMPSAMITSMRSKRSTRRRSSSLRTGTRLPVSDECR